ncbi:hypothetical protein BP5796_08245 [Coleophoma crateriformis]|uniref:Zn(2)-C6 fungal-type domain-containing protein n=1 Tax=Coleophoma crateriformis TaxID=565419 RepID=A0A3D8REA5_9HELO|nr:hypothetical protein BP5796_08245 [Coleophoma crateriformis]
MVYEALARTKARSDECQSRHLKCNLVKPCGPCDGAGRLCTESSRYKFRHDDNPTVASGRRNRSTLRFAEDQTWPNAPKKFTFVVEDPGCISDLDKNFEHNGLGLGPVPSVSPAEDQVEDLPTTSGLAKNSANAQWHRVGVDNARGNETNTPSQVSPPHHPSVADTCEPPSREYGRTLWPLPAKDEARLLRYFVNELSSWIFEFVIDSMVQFDYCDKQKHFSTEVIQAAATSPTLHNAILAVTAKFLSVTQDFDRSTPDKYQRECLRTLIPALTVPEAMLDENLFAATVILRFFDEMTERADASHTETHVLGSHMLVNARERARTHTSPTYTSSLRIATLFIELRQEIHIAFMTNRPPPPLVEYCNIERSIDPADDWIWMNRIVAHTADVLTYCNGDGNKNLARWRENWAYLDAWEGAIPPSFKPIYEESADPDQGQLFPVLWFAIDCHASGKQYLAISKILLLAHDPNVASLGLDRIAKQKDNDAQIKTQVRTIAGIALSNRQSFPTMLMAAVAIAMCGERFTDRKEQEAFIQIVAEAEAHVAWPSLRARERLRTFWGWDTP